MEGDCSFSMKIKIDVFLETLYDTIPFGSINENCFLYRIPDKRKIDFFGNLLEANVKGAINEAAIHMKRVFLTREHKFSAME